jgi:hypothetical protein
MDPVTLQIVGPDNLAACGIGCVTNSRHRGFQAKGAWLEQRFREGLRYLLARDGAGKPLAFLEYVPGEYAWRPVDACGWWFVHCLWVFRRGQQVGGLGSRLIQACVEEARRQRVVGVAAMVSDGPWMAGRQVFIKNGFRQAGEADRFQLVTHRLRKGPAPRFRETAPARFDRRGLHLVYCAQCPMLQKSVDDLSGMAAEHGLKMKLTVLDSAKAAQHAPSYYGVFSLLWNGRLLSDHYVSRGRFKNLLSRQILKK